MPQLDVSTFISQIFWLIISFSLVWMVIGGFVVPKISDIVQRRQHKIDEYLSAAEKFKQSAEELVARYKTAIKKAELSADKIWADTRVELQKKNDKLQEDMSARLKERAQENDVQLHKIEDDIKAQIDNISVSLAEKIITDMGLSFISVKDVIQKGDGDE